MKKIGLVSGAGAFSGLIVFKAVLDYFVSKNAKKDNEFPYLVLSNYPFSCLNNMGVEDIGLFKKEIRQSLKDVADCDHIIVLCNSFHFKIDQWLPKKYQNRILELPTFLSPMENKKTLLLTSQFSRDFKVFDNYGFNYEYLDDELQNLLNKQVQQVICGDFSFYNDFLLKLSEKIQKDKIEQVVLGCTELYCLDWNFITNEEVIIVNPLNNICEKIFDLTLMGGENESV